MRRAFAVVLMGSVLFGCSAPVTAPESMPTADSAQLRRKLTALPGARVGDGDLPSVSYPGEVLFAEGAAVPLPGGTALLDPLASFLASQGDLRWRATVRAHTEGGAEHERALAEKRGELLMRYFLSRGVPGERVELATESAEGPPLELTPLQPARDASSSRSKP